MYFVCCLVQFITFCRIQLEVNYHKREQVSVASVDFETYMRKSLQTYYLGTFLISHSMISAASQ